MSSWLELSAVGKSGGRPLGRVASVDPNSMEITVVGKSEGRPLGLGSVVDPNGRGSVLDPNKIG